MAFVSNCAALSICETKYGFVAPLRIGAFRSNAFTHSRLEHGFGLQ